MNINVKDEYEVREPERAFNKAHKPVIPKPSGNQTMNSIFQLNHPSRRLVTRGKQFSLLEDLQSLISSRLRNINNVEFGHSLQDTSVAINSQANENISINIVTDPEISVVERRLSVYRETFNELIEGFGKYKPILANIKNEYEIAYENVKSLAQSSYEHRVGRAALISQHDEIIASIKANYESQLQSKSREIIELSDFLKSAESRNRELLTDRDSLSNRIEVLTKDLENSRNSNITLVNAAKRAEDEKRAFIQSQQSFSDIETNLKSSELRAYAEVERLANIVTTLESRQNSLVSKDVIDQMSTEICQLEDKITNLSRTNRQLVERYVMLKCYVCQGEEEPLDNRILESAINIVKDDPTLNALQEKRLLEPRQLIELMLNKIQSLTSKVSEIEEAQITTTPDVRIGTAEHEEWSFIPSLGNDISVPVYLQAPVSMRIRNLRLTLREIEAFIEDIWDKRALDVNSDKPRTHRNYVNYEPSQLLTCKTEEAPHGASGANIGQSTRNIRSNKHSQYMNTRSSRLMSVSKYSKAMIKRPSVLKTSKAFLHQPTCSAVSIHEPIEQTNEYKTSAFEEYFIEYLQQRFKSSDKTIEAAYNLIEGADMYSCGSGECRLFLHVLRGELAEETRQEFQRQIHTLKVAFRDEEALLNMLVSREKYFLPLDSVIAAIRKSFELKSVGAVNDLVKAATIDVAGRSQIDYRILTASSSKEIVSEFTSQDFCEATKPLTNAFRRSRLFETLYRQCIDDCLDSQMLMIDNIQSALKGSASSDDGSKTLTVGVIREGLSTFDPSISRSEMTAYLCRCFGMETEDLLVMEGRRVEVEWDGFIKQMKQHALHRVRGSTGKIIANHIE